MPPIRPLRFLAALAIPLAARAQGPACSFDTAAVVRPHSLAIGLAPAGPDLTASGGMEEVLWMADAIASHFSPPSTVTLPLWARLTSTGNRANGSDGSTRPVSHGLDAFFGLTLRPDGHLASTDVRITTASEELNASLLAAVLATDEAGDIPALSDSLRRAGGRVRFRIVDMESARVTAVPLMRVTVPEIPATSPIRAHKRPAIQYPRNAAYAGVSDSIEVAFVVNADGTVRSDQVWPIRSKYLDFFIAIVEGLVKTTFEPARVGACPVPALAFQQLHFEIRR